MYDHEKIKPYNKEATKREQVECMFDQIAPTYDTLNHRLSWNIDRYWRRKAIDLLVEHKPNLILDIATGTGDFVIQSAKALKPKQLIGIDISERMMSIGQEKVRDLSLNDIISFQKEDCESMSFSDSTFDAVTVAFGIRNFSNLEKCLHEILRVLKKNGHLVIIELTSPKHFPFKQLFKVYSHTILPLYAKIISKDKDAYKYLVSTIESFPQGEVMQHILTDIGFKEVIFKRLTAGICTLYLATKQ